MIFQANASAWLDIMRIYIETARSVIQFVKLVQVDLRLNVHPAIRHILENQIQL